MVMSKKSIFIGKDIKRMAIISLEYHDLLEALKQRVAASRYKAVIVINRELLLLYHYIGKQILHKLKQEAGL